MENSILTICESLMQQAKSSFANSDKIVMDVKCFIFHNRKGYDTISFIWDESLEKFKF